MNKILHIGLSTLPNTHSKEMREAFIAEGWICEDIAVQNPNLNSEIIRVANEFKPTVAFIQIQDRGISREAIQALKSNNCFIINWSGDLRIQTPGCYLEYAQFGVDLTCFSNMVDIRTMINNGYKSDWLQIGFSTEIYSPYGIIDEKADIVFMGNSFNHFPLSGLRREMVKELKRVYGDRFKAFGSGQPDGSLMGNQSGEAAVYRGAKIGINLSHFDSERYTSDRLFRMLGTRILVLSHEYKGIYEDFNPHDIGIWRNFDELKSQINYYLANEEARLKIAANGHQKAVEKYSFRSMGENILQLYNKYNS